MRQLAAFAVCLFLAIIPTIAQDKKKPAPKAEPRVLLSVPLGAIPGKTTKLTLRGRNLDDAKEVRVVAGKGGAKILSRGKAGVPDKNPDQVGDTQVEIDLKLDASFSGDSVSLVVVTPAGETKPHAVLVEMVLPLISEREPNDAFRTAHPLVLPVVIDGAIGRPKDIDVVRIEGKKGQKLYVETLASRHGSPLDAILTVYDAKYQQLVVNDDFDKGHHDAKIECVLRADGVYYVSLIDAHDAGGSLHAYRLVIK